MKNINDFKEMKRNNEKISVITAYDFPSAKIVEESGIDMILVGDSLGMVVLGYDSTVYVTLDDMIHHTRAVKRGAKNTFILVDLPFLTYNISIHDTLKNAKKLVQEGGANAIKLEGSGEVMKHISALTNSGIAVCSHLGLTPQSIGVLGSYKVQGTDTKTAKKLIEDAKNAELAGAFCILLECVPYQLAKKISEIVTIPVIGIGAGPYTDAQVLVYHDIIGYGIKEFPKFVKNYTDIDSIIKTNIQNYIQEVKNQNFPDKYHSYNLKENVLKSLYGK